MRDEATLKLINTFAHAVKDVVLDNKDGQAKLNRMDKAGAELFRYITGRKMPKELREQILT